MPPEKRNNTDTTTAANDLLASLGQSAKVSESYSPMPEGYVPGRTKYVVVLGTVMSGLGKGIFASSLAKLMKYKGLSVAPIKMEGYLNIDSGTLNPYRHGEVFVLDDGLETDMDLGTYERMLDQNLSRANFITAGQIYTDVLDRERRGGYLGRDVQMIPHVTGEVKRKLRQLALTGNDGKPVDVVFVEVGGTVGDYENGFYIEALRELAFEEGPESTCFVALTYIIAPSILGEQKSKAAQLGIKRLLEAGIQPAIIACRAECPVSEQVMDKIGMFSNVPMSRIFSMHDRESIYSIPDAMRGARLDREILSILNLHNSVDPVHEDRERARWQQFTARLASKRKHEVNVAITGKYASLRDAYASIDKALEHCGVHLDAKINAHWIDTSDLTSIDAAANVLEGMDAIIVPGGFGQRGVEGKINCAEYARTKGLPFLGICLGFQIAVVEYARNVLGLNNADSTEFLAGGANSVISELPEQKKLEGILGGTMRLGSQVVQLAPGSLVSQIYDGALSARERFRHRYEVEPSFIDQFEKAGLTFSGRHPEFQIMQVFELAAATHPYFIGAQFHPELTSRPLHPSPMFMGLVAAAIRKADPGTDESEIPARWAEKHHESNGEPMAAPTG